MRFEKIDKHTKAKAKVDILSANIRILKDSSSKSEHNLANLEGPASLSTTDARHLHDAENEIIARRLNDMLKHI